MSGLVAAEAVAEPVMIGYYLRVLALAFEAFGEPGADLARAGVELLARRTPPWYMEHLFNEVASEPALRRRFGAAAVSRDAVPPSTREAIATARSRGARLLEDDESIPPPLPPAASDPGQANGQRFSPGRCAGPAAPLLCRAVARLPHVRPDTL